MLPETYTLSCRMGQFDDESDIELRTPTEKFTVASNVDDRFVPIFLASHTLLTACEAAEKFIAGFEDDPVQEGVPTLLKTIRDAIEDARQDWGGAATKPTKPAAPAAPAAAVTPPADDFAGLDHDVRAIKHAYDKLAEAFAADRSKPYGDLFRVAVSLVMGYRR